MDGRCTSSHENKTFRSKSVVKQKGMVFGFRKTATAVTRPEREIDKGFFCFKNKIMTKQAVSRALALVTVTFTARGV